MSFSIFAEFITGEILICGLNLKANGIKHAIKLQMLWMENAKYYSF